MLDPKLAWFIGMGEKQNFHLNNCMYISNMYYDTGNGFVQQSIKNKKKSITLLKTVI